MVPKKKKKGGEPRFELALKLLFAANILPQGDVIDAGANDGSTTFMLARMLPKRGILAVEPLGVNVRHIRHQRQSQRTPNVKVIHGALGASEGRGSYNEEAEKGVGRQIGLISFHDRFREGNGSYQIYTVDALFRNRTLAFAHWDVEGRELEVLRGAKATLRRDRPIFTVETHAQHYPKAHAAVLKHVRGLDYTVFTIPEPCGWSDCRNHVCVPASIADKVRRVISGAIRSSAEDESSAFPA